MLGLDNLEAIAITIVTVTVLSLLAASLPDSIAWLIGRWFDICTLCQTNRHGVRHRLSEVEVEFRERYEAERKDSSGATRATIRAFWYVAWKVLKAPAIAGAVDRSVATQQNPKRSTLVRLSEAFVSFYGIRFTLGPIPFLLVATPLIAIGVFLVVSTASSVLSPSLDASRITFGCLFCISISLFIAGLIAKTRFQRFSISDSFRSIPRRRTAAFLLVLYYVFWGMNLALTLEMLPSDAPPSIVTIVYVSVLMAIVTTVRERPLQH